MKAFILVFFVFSAFVFPAFAAESQEGEEISSKGIETIEETMKNLAGSMGEMPAAPQFKGKIQVPTVQRHSKEE